MPLELDHVFVCTDRTAPAADLLKEFGLLEGAANRHPGQGTANRRFFFHNAFLELLWVEEPAEAQSASVARTGLWERWSQRDRGASPFGVCLRVVDEDAAPLPFPSWDYRPPYLPPPLAIHMAEHSRESTAPLLFAIAFGRRADAEPRERRQPLDHPAGVRNITRLRITAPAVSATIAAEWTALNQVCSQVELAVGTDPMLEIGFDDECQPRVCDVRPHLPLILRW